MREPLAAESDSAQQQIAKLEARAASADAERDVLLEKARTSCRVLLLFLLTRWLDACITYADPAMGCLPAT